MKSLVVSLHDVSPLTQTWCEEILAQLLHLGIDQTSLLIIPNHHRRAPISEDSGFRSWLARNIGAGHYAVLHGSFHQRQKQETDSIRTKLTNQLYPAGEGQFFDLSTKEASTRAQRGLEELAFLPRKVVGFIAPAWLLGANAELAIRKLGFSYTTRLGRLQTFGRTADIRSQSLVWSTRAPWRAMTSLWWNRCLAFGLARSPLIRIGIHPSDLQNSAVGEQARRLAPSPRRSRNCLTYAEFVESLS